MARPKIARNRSRKFMRSQAPDATETTRTAATLRPHVSTDVVNGAFRDTGY
jgi:hypothetical protein